MQIILEKKPNQQLAIAVNPTEDNEKIVYGDLLNLFLNGLTGVTNRALEDFEFNEENREALYMSLDSAFQAFLLDLFPEFNISEEDKFSLSDAALIKAQDDIINEAYKEGITFKEALEKYEKEAEEYINARQMS